MSILSRNKKRNTFQNLPHVSKIYKALGYKVHRVQIINDKYQRMLYLFLLAEKDKKVLDKKISNNKNDLFKVQVIQDPMHFHDLFKENLSKLKFAVLINNKSSSFKVDYLQV
ncbi:MAG: hypothetical protein ACJZZG_04025 [Cytophagales bacterium]